ncbi:MAG: DMT family transporter, partial [Bacillota bacterium]
MDTVSLLAFSSVAAIWGSTYLAIKIGLNDLPPLTFATLRFAIASLVMFGYLALKRERIWPRRDEWLPLLGMSLCMTSIPYGLVFWGQQYVSSGMASILTASMPLFVVFIAWGWIGEPLTLSKVGGVMMGLA